MSTTTPKFKTKSGRLTAYSFCCGYREQKTTNPDEFQREDLYTELYHEHSCYHVRQFDRRPGAKEFRTIWEGFPKLKDAREFFDNQEGERVG